MRKVRAIIYCVHLTKYNQIICKRLRVITMKIYRLVQFHTWRYFCSRLSVRVSYSGQTVTYTRKYCTNNPGKKPYGCMAAVSTQNCALLNYTTILHTETFFTPAYHWRKKLSSETKMSHYSLLHPRALHMSVSTSIYDSKIYSIKSDHFPLGQNIHKSVQP